MAEKRSAILGSWLDAADRDAAQTGDEYLKNWAWLAQEDPEMPRLSQQRIHYKDVRYPDPEGGELARKRFMAERAFWFVQAFVDSLNDRDQDIVYSAYLRRIRKRAAGTSWFEPIRKWQTEEIIKAVGIPRRTYFHQRKLIREGVAKAAQIVGVPLPP